MSQGSAEALRRISEMEQASASVLDDGAASVVDSPAAPAIDMSTLRGSSGCSSTAPIEGPASPSTSHWRHILHHVEAAPQSSMLTDSFGCGFCTASVLRSFSMIPSGEGVVFMQSISHVPEDISHGEVQSQMSVLYASRGHRFIPRRAAPDSARDYAFGACSILPALYFLKH